MKVRTYGFSRKVNSEGSLIDSGKTIEVEVTEVIELGGLEWEEFKNNLDDNYYWLIGVEGYVLVKNKEGQGAIVVDTQGYDYARYAARALWLG